MAAIPKMQMLNDNSDYSMTLYEVCEYLGKSTRTISRYVHKNILHPRGTKSRQGTLEYRFSRAEVEQVRQKEKLLHPYGFDGDTPIRANYAAASFADYGSPAASLAQPPQVPYLVPGVSYPSAPGQVMPNAAAVWPPATAPSFNVPAQSYPLPYSGITPQKKPARGLPRESFQKQSAGDLGKETKKEEKSVPANLLKNEVDRGNEQIISLLKETTGMLRDQLKAKDDQIKNLDDKIGQLLERNRETNILLKGLQDKIMLLEKPKDRPEKVASPAETKAETKTEPDNPGSINEAKIGEEAEKDEDREEIKIKFSASPNLPIFRDTPAADVRQAAAPPPPSAFEAKDEKAIEPVRKGLFGKIFG